ncbi:MAG: acyl-CoA thioesterase [Ktedonobacteraceae bacterium]|nr:acyl-CoA thioesterase [Ktedonobacteraceae bacterium]
MPQVRIQVRVPFVDVDSSGRIHFTAMLRYMEIAEHELVRSLGFPRTTTFLDIGFPRVHVSCDYHRAIGYDDELTVEATVERVGRSSWTVAFTAYFTQELNAQEPAESTATGRMTIVAIDKTTERARPIPEELRAALSKA